MAKSSKAKIVRATDWQHLIEFVTEAQLALRPDKTECLWFRGTDSSHQLSPTLMRDTAGHSRDAHDTVEQNLFFEFQAKSYGLRSQNLTDWEYLFYSRHHGVPTRLLDWTDTLGVAVYFALEPFMNVVPKNHDNATPQPALWALNPYSLNEETWKFRDIVLPRYLGCNYDEDDEDDAECLDYGELLVANDGWAWDGPVAVYPIQLGDRVRAQRGWFTVHGNDRKPLEEQYPALVWQIVLGPKCVDEGLQFLEWAGFNRYSIYPDLDHLAIWLRQKNLQDLTGSPSKKLAGFTKKNKSEKAKRAKAKQ